MNSKKGLSQKEVQLLVPANSQIHEMTQLTWNDKWPRNPKIAPLFIQSQVDILESKLKIKDPLLSIFLMLL